MNSPRKGTRGSERYLAALLDNVLAFVFAGATVAILEDSRNKFIPGILAISVYWLYYFLSEGVFSATPGKLLWGLRVVGDDGRRCGFGKAFLQSLTRLVETNPVFLGGLPAAVLITFTPRRRRLGDFLASTLVVRTSDLEDESYEDAVPSISV